MTVTLDAPPAMSPGLNALDVTTSP
jgi:hypothetical protein